MKRTTYSYHIQKNFGNVSNPQWISWWPFSGFGQYCTERKEAEEQMEREEVGNGLRLVRFTLVGGLPIGVTGEQEVLAERAE